MLPSYALMCHLHVNKDFWYSDSLFWGSVLSDAFKTSCCLYLYHLGLSSPHLTLHLNLRLDAFKCTQLLWGRPIPRLLMAPAPVSILHKCHALHEQINFAKHTAASLFFGWQLDMRTHTHTHACTYMCTYKHTHTHIHTYTHKHTQTTAEAQLSVPVQGGDTCTGPAAIVLCQLLGMVRHSIVTCWSKRLIGADVIGMTLHAVLCLLLAY